MFGAISILQPSKLEDNNLFHLFVLDIINGDKKSFSLENEGKQML